MEQRETIKSKKRIVIKVGTTTITHKETGNIDLEKLEKFVRILINLRNKGKEVIVVSSGAVGIGRQVLGIWERLEESAIKQACAAVGQGRMMMMYEKLFAEYDQLTAQVLLTKESIMSKECRQDARNTFEELLRMNVVPIVNENDAISVEEEAYGNFGDNDTMAAHVARLVEADLLILMSDIEGLYTDDPRKNPNARFVHTVRYIDEKLERMGKGPRGGKGSVTFGFEEPYLTGQVLSAAALIYPFFEGNLEICPVFDETVFEAEGSFKGRIRAGYLLWLGLGILRDGHTRRMLFGFLKGSAV